MEYLPTGDMIADILTKPLHGTLFARFANIILGNENSTLSENCMLYKLIGAQRTNDIPLVIFSVLFNDHTPLNI